MRFIVLRRRVAIAMSMGVVESSEGALRLYYLGVGAFIIMGGNEIPCWTDFRYDCSEYLWTFDLLVRIWLRYH